MKLLPGPVHLIAGGLGMLMLVGAGSPGQVEAQTVPHKLIVQSPALKTGEPMPRDYTPDGRNISPPLSWSNLPPGTRKLAVVCADFGAGNPPPWVHWIIYNIPATAKALPAGLPIDPAAPMPGEIAGAVQGLNGWRRAIYRGPAPPAGTPHLYYFTVYALDTELTFGPNLTRAQLLEAMSGHIIGQGEIVPTYERKPIAPAP
jgi:Raf kinase inhibitor-like YbhB/YbcL family protein